MALICPQWLQTNGLSGEVILHYFDQTNGIFDAFDLLTGLKTSSVQLKLKDWVEKGSHRVGFLGIPGRQVAAESSTDMKTWTDTGSVVTIDPSGRGVFTPMLTWPQQFFRGRLIP